MGIVRLSPKTLGRSVQAETGWGRLSIPRPSFPNRTAAPSPQLASVPFRAWYGCCFWTVPAGLWKHSKTVQKPTVPRRHARQNLAGAACLWLGINWWQGKLSVVCFKNLQSDKTDGISTLTAQSLLAITGNLAFFLFLPSLKQRNSNPTDPGSNLKQWRFLTSLGLSVRS